MATASLTTSPTQIDTGVSDNVSITNTGTTDVTIVRGSQSFTLRPTQTRVIYPEGAAVTAATASGTGSVSYAATAARTSAAQQFAADAAFTNTYAQKIGQSIILTGDSWTAFEGGAASVATPSQSLGVHADSKGILNVANVILRHAFVVVGNAGIGGQTSAQIAARFATDVVAYKPAWVKIQAGTNDVDSTYNTKTNLAAMYDAAAAAGIKVIAATIPPNTAAPLAQRQWYLQVNKWIRDQARLRRDFVLADYAAAIADPATTWQAVSGMLVVDNVHPSAAGAMAMGYVLANAVKPFLATTNDYLAAGAGEPDNLLSNPMMNGSGSTVPTGWTSGGSPTISYVTRTDGLTQAKWCQLAVGAGTGAFLSANVSIGASVAIGDTVVGAIEFECDSLEASPSAGIQGPPNLRVQFYNGASFFSSVYDLYWDSTYANAKYPAPSGVLQTRPIVVPATTTIVQIVASTPGGGNYRLGRAALRKVPTGTTYV